MTTTDAANLVFLGPPGSGKGTQAAILARNLKLVHVSTGDLLREEVQAGSDLGKQAEHYMTEGVLVPDDVIIKMVRERLAKPDAQTGFLLDGFPRTVAQADALTGMLSEIGRDLDAVVSLVVDDAEVVRRIAGRLTCRGCGAVFHVESMPPKQPGICDKCGGELYQRSDDTEEAVRSRLATYNERTEPLLAYYREKSLLRSVEAVGSVESVQQRILEALRDTQ